MDRTTAPFVFFRASTPAYAANQATMDQTWTLFRRTFPQNFGDGAPLFVGYAGRVALAPGLRALAKAGYVPSDEAAPMLLEVRKAVRKIVDRATPQGGASVADWCGRCEMVERSTITMWLMNAAEFGMPDVDAYDDVAEFAEKLTSAHHIKVLENLTEAMHDALYRGNWQGDHTDEDRRACRRWHADDVAAALGNASDDILGIRTASRVDSDHPIDDHDAIWQETTHQTARRLLGGLMSWE